MPPTNPTPSDILDPNPEDVAIVAMLKAVWREHRGDPGVACAIRDALSRGLVSTEQARAIESSAAFAVAERSRDAKAFGQVDNDPHLLAEAVHLQNFLDPKSLASCALDLILQDGKVTREEMRAFAKAYLVPGDKERLLLVVDADKRQRQRLHDQAQASRPSIFAIPTLVPRPPAPSFSKDGRDGGTGGGD